MRKGFRNRRLWSVALTAALLCGLASPGRAQDAAPQDGSISSSVKSGWQKITKPFTPGEKPPEPEKVDKSLSIKEEHKPKTAVYVAVARLFEQSGNFADAEKQYQAVLKENPKDIAALNGYARLKERMGFPDEAIKLYQQAVKADPRDAGSYNNLGLCYARKEMFDDAIVAMGRAVLLQPKNVLYRNNMATILVDRGKNAEAFSHLRAVHSEAAAYYNMGYLLNRKGKREEAAENFAAALRLDSTMVSAKNWLDRLQGPAPTTAPATAVVAAPQPPAVKPASNLAAQRAGLPGWQGGSRAAVEEPSWPPRNPALVRLPPTSSAASVTRNPADATPPAAPLPPETTWRPASPPGGTWR